MTLKRFTLLTMIAATFVLSDVTTDGYTSTVVNAAQDETQDADEAAKKPSRIQARADRRRARIMAEYEATGKIVECVPMRSVRQSRILDDQTIFFESIGKRGYMNRMPQKCVGLLREERFAYANSFGSLCRAQIITVLDDFGRTWGSCGLGDFEEYIEKPKADTE